MRFVITLLLFMGIFIAINAQGTLRYSYDASGNRVAREIVLSRQAEDSKEPKAQPYEERLSTRQVKIYPNPTKGNLKIEISDFTDCSGELYLYNTAGILLTQETVVSGFGVIDISNETNGLYILKIVVNNEVSTWRIIKE